MSFMTAPVMRLRTMQFPERWGWSRAGQTPQRVSNREPVSSVCPLVLIHHLPLGDLSGSETLSAPVSAFAVCTVQALNGAWGWRGWWGVVRAYGVAVK